MVTNVVTIEPAASLADAARAMTEANIGMLPVVDDGKVTGVITAAQPTAAATKATPSSKKGAAGSISLLAAAAGMALMTRDKLGRLTHRGGTDPVAAGMSEITDTTQANNTAMPPSTSSL